MDWFYNNLESILSFPVVLYIPFLLALGITSIVSLALFYHWSKYSVGIVSVAGAMILYLFGAIVFLGSMLLVILGAYI